MKVKDNFNATEHNIRIWIYAIMTGVIVFLVILLYLCLSGLSDQYAISKELCMLSNAQTNLLINMTPVYVEYLCYNIQHDSDIKQEEKDLYCNDLRTIKIAEPLNCEELLIWQD